MQIRDLAPNSKNPRKITEAKQKMLLKALRRFGDLSGLVFNRKSKQLVGGHQRRGAFSPDTPIVITKKYSKPTKTGTVAEGYIEAKGERFSYREVHWDAHTEKAANIAANKGAGVWDPGKLKEWIQELNGFDVNFDLNLTMFDADEIKDITGIEVKGYTRTNEKTGVDEDEVPEKPPPRTKLGDVYTLGRHRLICGDSTRSGVVSLLLNGRAPELVFTDPPYGIDYQDVKKNHKKIENDSELSAIPALLDETLKFGCPLFICCNWKSYSAFEKAMTGAKRAPKACIVWDKGSRVQNLDKFGKQHEFILYSGPFGGEKTVDVDVWQCRREVSTSHPTAKPVELVSRALLHFDATYIVDLFGGSGTTLIACEKTARSCYTAELDPSYCDVIVARWEKYTGLKARLIRTETKRKPSAKANGKANGESKSQASAKT